MLSPLEGETARRSCPVCDESRSDPARTRRDGAQLVECVRCGLLYVNPAPTASALEKFYSSYWGPFRKPQRPTRASVANAVARGSRDVVEEFVVQSVGRVPESVADVGCGGGGRLARLRARGAQRVAGCEPDEKAAAWARDQLGLDVVAGDADKIELPATGYEVVILSEVLEHVLDPVHLLRQCARLLGRNGVLVVTTPNAGVRFRARTDWKGLETDFDHVAVFDDRSIREALTRAGLRAREVMTWGLPVDSGEVGNASAPSVLERVGRGVEHLAARAHAQLRRAPVLEVNEGYRLFCSATRNGEALA